MNIPVKTHSGKIIVRPDTTWERDNEDLYLADFIERLTYTPVLFARICKPGRSIGIKFADRYFDGIGYGILLYPENMIEGCQEGFACASCVDHTSFLPFPVFDKVTLGQEDNAFSLFFDGAKCFEYSEGNCGMICEALSEASRYVYVRSGDIIAIELAPRKECFPSPSGKIDVEASFCENKILDFSIIR